MVKRGGKEVITVEIFKETYDAMKVVAARKRWSAKDYINTVLMEAIERDKFLRSYAPSLSKVGYEDDILFIRDKSLAKPRRYTFATALGTVMSANLRTVSISTMLLPCQKLQSSIFVG